MQLLDEAAGPQQGVSVAQEFGICCAFLVGFGFQVRPRDTSSGLGIHGLSSGLKFRALEPQAQQAKAAQQILASEPKLFQSEHGSTRDMTTAHSIPKH